MYHNKQIAVFISHIYGEYQTNLCQGILDSASAYGYHIEVFTTSDGENLGSYNLAEDAVATLPDYSEFDGIIFASGTYVNPALKMRLRRQFQAFEEKKNAEQGSGKRFVVEISNDPSPFLSITLENNLTSGILTDHLITVHGAKRICFLGSTLDRVYSEKRKNACLEVLEKNALPADPEDAFFTDESESSYVEALRRFTRRGSSLPDAVVCYNDRLAMEFIKTAYEAGYKVPEDFAVVGCDHSKAGQSMDPPLTTVTFPAYELGETAVKSLIAGFKGKADPVSTVFAQPVYGGTCGCSHYGKKPGFLYARELMLKISQVESSILASLRMTSYLPVINEVDEALSYLEEYAEKINGLSGFYLCLYSDWDAVEEIPSQAEDQVVLKLALKNGEKLPECTFRKNTLLPGFLTSSLEDALIISHLTYGERIFGYIALSFKNDRLNYPFQLIQWIINISQLLQKIRSRKETMHLAGKLEDYYYTDSLTGLYNREGFAHFYDASYDQLLLLDFYDYGKICASYGMQEGDFALTVISQAIFSQMSDLLLPSYIKDGYFQVAVKGDTDVEELISRIQKYLTHYSQLNPRPYEIKARFGYAKKTEPDLPYDALFAAAEENLK